MRWKLKNGKVVTHRDSKYRIDFESKAPSKLAQTLKDFLKENANSHVLFEEYRLPGSLLRVDFLDATCKIAYEVNGEQHTEFVEFFQRYRYAFQRQIKNDIRKIEFLNNNGYRVIELEEPDIKLLSRKFLKEKFGITF